MTTQMMMQPMNKLHFLHRLTVDISRKPENLYLFIMKYAYIAGGIRLIFVKFRVFVWFLQAPGGED